MRGDVAESRCTITPQEGTPRGRVALGTLRAGYWRVEVFSPDLFRHPGDPEWQRALDEGSPLVGCEPPAEGLAMARRIVRVIGGERASTLLTIAVDPARGARLIGRVRGVESLDPDRLQATLQGVVLELDEIGSFDSGWVPPGELRLQLNIVGADRVVQNPPLVVKRVRVKLGEERHIALEVPPTERVHFEIVDSQSGNPVDRVAARVERVGTTFWRPLRADRDVWRFEAGEYQALLSRDGYECSLYRFTIEPVGGSTVPLMKLTRRKTDRRVLVGPDGREMRKGSVRFRALADETLSPRMAPTAILDEDGAFDAAIVPAGQYPVSISSQSHGSVRGKLDLRGPGLTGGIASGVRPRSLA